jgi:hypothetical protein
VLSRTRRSPAPVAALALAAVLLGAALPVRAGAGQQGDLVASYIDRWAAFYPSRAYARGHAPSAARFEQVTPEAVEQWLAVNRATAASARERLAGTGLAAERRTDLAVLAGAAENELANWAEDRPLRAQPGWYAERVSQALTHLLVRDEPAGAARSEAALARLAGVEALCLQGIDALETGKTLRTEAALRTLAGARTFYGEGLPGIVADWPRAAEIVAAATRAADAIAALEAHLRDAVLPAADPSPALGASVYAAKLSRRTGGVYTPATLRDTARDEISRTRALMVDEAARWQASLSPAPPEPLAGEALLAAALAAMEEDRTRDQAALLEEFVTLTAQAGAFVEAEDIATVPKPTTLVIDLSPAHFSGAAIGGVYPSGPFDPGADTLFYVPSIPDSAPAGAREGFYRSFNTHFNTMIISHEMFPGHYLQYKVAVSAAPALRTLFASGSYTEGWGSFSEELMLDAGWAGNAPLTRLAHLRKRLENATRAFVSVQVHTAGWGRDEVLAFARDEGLLAPQFAINLWQRVVNSPLQITDYMTGYLVFKRLYAAQHDAGTSPRAWVDAVLRAGPLPLALLETELARALAAAPGP